MAREEEEDLTVEEILEASQTAEAAAADEGSGRTQADPSPGAEAQAESVGDETSNAAEDESASVDPLEDIENPYLDDLRRVTAEYANYRKRTEANAEIERQRATAVAVASLLTVLDDLDRAEEHGDLVEGSAFATIAQKVRAALERMGVESFGEKGEDFDPQMHEAIAQVPVPGTEKATVLDVIERGYRIGEVELRPAKVAVAVAADG